MAVDGAANERTYDDRSNVQNDGNNNQWRWTMNEHQVFLDGLETHGRQCKKIAENIPTRSLLQVRGHDQKYFQNLLPSVVKLVHN